MAATVREDGAKAGRGVCVGGVRPKGAATTVTIDTCSADGGDTLGQSRPTIEIAQGEKLHQTGARGFVRAIVDKISTLVTVTQQGPQIGRASCRERV